MTRQARLLVRGLLATLTVAVLAGASTGAVIAAMPTAIEYGLT
ncbi:MAG: hypothetical protein ACRD2C_27005 [Acidimicrobiales bacterium]